MSTRLFQRNKAGEPVDQRARMLETPVSRLIPVLAVPTIISMLVTSLYNMADTYFVSQINTSASGAVGIVFSVMAIIQAAGFTVGLGTGSIVSRLLGQNKREGRQVETYASSGVCLALVVGALLAALGLCNLDGLIWLLGSTATIHPYAKEYAWYILLGAPVMVLSYTLNNLLRWQGRAQLATIGLATGGILNIILDPLFIFVFGMGIGGAGAATLLSQCISMSILASMFLFKHSDVHLSPAFISRSPKVYLAILKQGMPSFFRQGSMSAANVALNFNAKLYGDAAVAALAIVAKVFMLVQSIIIGFGQAFQPVLGYSYGARKLDRVKEALVFSLKICTSILLAAAAIGLLFAPQIIALFRRDDPDVIAIGTWALRFQCLTLPLSPLMMFTNMLFQSLGKSGRASFLAMFRQCIFIPLVFFLSSQFALTGLELTQATADLLAAAATAVFLTQYFRREFWKEAGAEP